MEILLSKGESEDFFFRALCNGLGYFQQYGLQLDLDKAAYSKSREKLKDPCIEDVLMQILKDGGTLSVIDHDCDGEYNKTITLEDVHKMASVVPAKWLFQMAAEEDDAETGDVILQCVFFGEITFG